MKTIVVYVIAASQQKADIVADMLIGANNIYVAAKTFQVNQRLLKNASPDIILVDCLCPNSECCKKRCALIHSACPDAKILVRMHPDETKKNPTAVLQGVSGFISHDHSRDDLINAIRNTCQGEAQAPSHFLPFFIDYFLSKENEIYSGNNSEYNFTPKELLVLHYLGLGYSNANIALILEVNEKTIKTHLKNMMNKTRAPNSKFLIGLAMFHGIGKYKNTDFEQAFKFHFQNFSAKNSQKKP